MKKDTVIIVLVAFLLILLVYNPIAELCNNKYRYEYMSASTQVVIYYQGDFDSSYLTKPLRIDFGITEFDITVLKDDKLKKETWKITLEKQ